MSFFSSNLQKLDVYYFPISWDECVSAAIQKSDVYEQEQLVRRQIDCTVKAAFMTVDVYKSLNLIEVLLFAIFLRYDFSTVWYLYNNFRFDICSGAEILVVFKYVMYNYKLKTFRVQSFRTNFNVFWECLRRKKNE